MVWKPVCASCIARLREKSDELTATIERMDRTDRNRDDVSIEAMEALVTCTGRAEVFAWELYRSLCDDCKKFVPPPPEFPTS